MRLSHVLAIGILSVIVCESHAAEVPQATIAGLPPQAIADFAASKIAEAIPREYEKYQDWGKTKRMTTGVDFKGHVWDPKIDRHKSEVNDGVWKHYRLTLVGPDKNLSVRIENLRSVDAGRIAFTLLLSGKVHGWAQARVFEEGVPLGTYTGEGDSVVDLAIDGEIAIETTPSSFISGIAIRPHVTAAQVKLDDFRLTRFGEIKGSLARELGKGMKDLIEDQLEGPKLVDKINHAIDKKQDKLKITPEKLLGLTTKK